MNQTFDDLSQLSREELYSLVNALKREINCLSTDLSRFKLLSIKLRKNLNDLQINTQFKQKIPDLETIDGRKCYINCGPRVETIAGSVDKNVKQFVVREEAEDNESDGNDCDVSHESDDEIIDESDEELSERQDSRGSHKKLNETNAKKSVSKGTGGQYACDWEGCGKRFVRFRHLDPHKHLHSGVTYRCDIPGCLASFSCLDYLRHHKNRVNHQKVYESMAEKIIDGSVDENDDKTTNDSQRESELKTKPKYSLRTNTKRKLKKSTEREDNESDDDYSCGSSGKEFSDNSDKHRPKSKHKKVPKIDGKYVCDYKECSKIYNSLGCLRSHQKSHSDQTFFCDFKSCSQHFRNWSALKVHLWTDKHVLGQPFQCDRNGCDYKSESKDQFVDHMSGHTSDELNKPSEGQYVCDWIGCGKRFLSRNGMISHKETHLEITYRCDTAGCKATFQTSTAFRDHIIRRHGTTYRCSHTGCPFRSGCKNYVRNHEITHSTNRQFLCGLNGCQKGFAIKRYVSDHQLGVHPELVPDVAWIACEWTGCEYRCKRNDYMKTHVDKKHTKPFRCDSCNARFGLKKLLVQHVRTHDKSAQLRCQWPGCEKTFATDRGLEFHTNTHTGANIYRCLWPGCDKTFVWKAALKFHEDNHTGVPSSSYRCRWPTCDYRSSNASNLRSHLYGHKGLKARPTDDYLCSYSECSFKSQKAAEITKHLKESHSN